MSNSKIKWLIYTVFVGLLPILSRIIVWIVTKAGTIEIFSPTDFVAFGLILHISIINEIEHFIDVGKDWKTIQNGVSILFIAVYSVLFALNIVGKDFIDIQAIKYCTFGLSVVSFLLSYSVYDRVSKIVNLSQG